MTLLQKILGVEGEPLQIDEMIVNQFLNSASRESLLYEFKEVTEENFNNIDFGKPISSFVNSQQGGLLFIGVTDPSDDGRTPGEINWFNATRPKLTVSALRNKIVDSTQPTCEFKITEVKKSGSATHKIYIIGVSPTSPVPCMNLTTKQYPRRLDGSTQAMDHNQIRSLFYQKIFPQTIITLKGKNETNSAIYPMNYRLKVYAKNIGSVSAEEPFFTLTITENLEVVPQRQDQYSSYDDRYFLGTRQSGQYHRHLGYSLHPGQEYDLGWLVFELRSEERPIKIEAKLSARDTTPIIRFYQLLKTPHVMDATLSELPTPESAT